MMARDEEDFKMRERKEGAGRHDRVDNWELTRHYYVLAEDRRYNMLAV